MSRASHPRRLVKPPWLKRPLPAGPDAAHVRAILAQSKLHTVCEEARCPNQGECWRAGTATTMILGDTCTRGCRFCAVATSATPPPPDPDEPRHVAEAVASLGLRYVVLTSVDRDDLPDAGAGHFAAVVQALTGLAEPPRVEVLTPDFGGSREALDVVVASKPTVFAHNVEVVRSLTPRVRDRRASYDQSLRVLEAVKEIDPAMVTKSSLMVGLGEDLDELRATLGDLRARGVSIVTIGQYLQPSLRQVPVARYYPPDEFEALETMAWDMGFEGVASGPMVRSSYMAGTIYDALVGASGRRHHDTSSTGGSDQ